MSSIVHSKIAPGEPEHGATLQVLRAVATFEVFKGMAVLLAACGILLLIHREDPWDIADGLLRLLHISPDHHFAQVFLDWADSLTMARIWAVAVAAISYDGRQKSLRPGESVGTMQTKAKSLVLIGSAPLLAIKL